MTKTITFGCMHISIAFTIVYLMTGSATVGGTVALVEPLCNTVGYFFHERFWERRSGGKMSEATSSQGEALTICAA